MVQRQKVASAHRRAGERDSGRWIPSDHHQEILEIGRAFGVEGLERFMRTSSHGRGGGARHRA